MRMLANGPGSTNEAYSGRSRWQRRLQRHFLVAQKQTSIRIGSCRSRMTSGTRRQELAGPRKFGLETGETVKIGTARAAGLARRCKRMFANFANPECEVANVICSIGGRTENVCRRKAVRRLGDVKTIRRAQSTRYSTEQRHARICLPSSARPAEEYKTSDDNAVDELIHRFSLTP